MADRISTLDTLAIRLAPEVPHSERYRRHYRPVDTESEVVSGDVPGLEGRPDFRSWRVRSWRGGEGITWWEPDRRQYRQSTNVRPVSIRDGLELGALQIVTDLTGGTVFGEGSRFGYGQGKVWAADDGAAHPWDPANQVWDTGVTTGAGASPITSMTDGDDTWMYSGHESGAIWRWKSGSSEEHYAAAAADPFVESPPLRSFAGTLYALDGDDLYEVDKTAADTRTQRGDPAAGSSSVYLAETPWAYGRMSLSDRGPIWLQRLDNGQTLLHLYNPFLDTQETLGKLAVDFAFPYSLFYTRGFAFTAFRYAPSHSESGDAYLWIKRGAQESYAGPFRAPSGVTASKPILIAGQIGDDVIVYFDGAVWAYNLTDGGLYQMSELTTTGTPEDAVTFGKDIFVAPVTESGGETQAVERFDTTRYTGQAASIDLGKHDWDYPGMEKILTEVTVVTDTLPANTSVGVEVSADGGAFTALSGSHSSGTKTVFVASSSSTTISGVEFEIRLVPASTDTSSTPTIREVSARATSDDHVLEWVMQIDAGTIGRQTSEDLIDGLNALAVSGAVVSWQDKFQQGEKETVDTFDVKVADVITPAVADAVVDEEPRATVKLAAVELQ